MGEGPLVKRIERNNFPGMCQNGQKWLETPFYPSFAPFRPIFASLGWVTGTWSSLRGGFGLGGYSEAHRFESTRGKKKPNLVST